MDATAVGDSIVFGSDASDTLFGGAGDDQIFVSAGYDIINSGPGDDVARFRGLMSDYRFEGSADGYSLKITDPLNGDTTILMGVETLSFEDGAVDVSYEDTGIVLTATSNSDHPSSTGPYSITVHGGDGSDFIYGADGADTLTGGDGTDTIDGGFGDDTLTGGLGDDVLEGGDGSDVAVFAGAMSAFTFSASSDGTLTVTDTNVGTSLGVDTVSGVEALQFTDGVLTVTTLSDGRVTLTGDGGSNEVTVVGETPVTLEGGAGNDAIDGGAGSDTLVGGDGSDTIDGGEGADVAVFAGHQSDYTFASSEDGLTVTVTDRSTGDFDTVTNVETLSFADGDIAVSHDGTGLVLVGQSADNIEVVGSVGVTVLGEAGDDHLMGG